MMVRKTLEAACDDRGAGGKNLYDRIESLRTKVTLPNELLDGLHEIRFLGNDAAHVSARDYDEIGKAEVEAVADFAKELLEALYQYESLMKRLQSLRKSTADSSS